MRWLVLLPILLLQSCASDPFHVETHYPTAYYERINKEDAEWIQFCQTNNL